MGVLAKNPPAGKLNGGLRNVDELLAEKARRRGTGARNAPRNRGPIDTR